MWKGKRKKNNGRAKAEGSREGKSTRRKTEKGKQNIWRGKREQEQKRKYLNKGT